MPARTWHTTTGRASFEATFVARLRSSRRSASTGTTPTWTGHVTARRSVTVTGP
ncbi:hypothetical protein ACPPVO_30465 [Dactylosporangium sp. McL0621]|uniref:hypothetical protein n=1 Tax=Dactylosporangium sp. McL0621 TaxID=3415678 RepID=UPI003CF45168